MRGLLACLGGILLLAGVPAQASDHGTEPMAPKYSQKVLMKNWALSNCLAIIATTQDARDDANATAAAYLEFGHQPIQAYEQLHALAQQFADRQYAGSVPSPFNTMKCVDLYNSRELDKLTTKWLGKK
ncbi:MAG TPA: T6SS amidase immunity protein Tai4 family protein [Magnetospirillum sp.]|nr:T6SS amidase immunity protein Tai4 family protein [Magnetospirillum sp.]